MIVEKEAFHRAIGKKNGGNKYQNEKVKRGNITFDSKKEAYRWDVLKQMEKNAQLRRLERQVRFECVVNCVKICTYVADFTYEERVGGHWFKVIEDVKSEFTKKLPIYRLKKKLVLAVFGINIQEV